MRTASQPLAALRKASIVGLRLYSLALPSAFLITHSSFFTILQNEYDFGFVLIILLGSVIAISSVWIIAGLRQYRMISDWNKRYANYLTNKEEIRKSIESEYSFTEDSEN